MTEMNALNSVMLSIGVTSEQGEPVRFGAGKPDLKRERSLEFSKSQGSGIATELCVFVFYWDVAGPAQRIR